MSLAPEAIRALVTGEHGDPFSVLGPHPGTAGTVEVRAFLPGARDPRDLVVCVCNFTAVPRHGYRVGVPRPGYYAEVVNTDSEIYGGGQPGQPGRHGERGGPLARAGAVGRPHAAATRRDLAPPRGGLTVALTVRRIHRMPFGAEVRDDVTRFRLWAPGARGVELWLEDEKRALAMPRDPEGWAELTARETPAGTRYRFRIDGEILVPDPASRCQPDGVHGLSEVVDPLAYSWSDAGWAGIPAERLIVNLGPEPVPHPGPPPEWGRQLYALGLGGPGAPELPPWGVGWYLAERER